MTDLEDDCAEESMNTPTTSTQYRQAQKLSEWCSNSKQPGIFYLEYAENNKPNNQNHQAWKNNCLDEIIDCYTDEKTTNETRNKSERWNEQNVLKETYRRAFVYVVTKGSTRT